MAENTGVRLDAVDIADGSGWQVDSTHSLDVFTRSAVSIEVRYRSGDDIETAVKRGARGEIEEVGKGTADAVERVRSWLTGRNHHQEQAHAATSGPTIERPQLYAEFWLRFRDRVAAEHPGWKARAGTSRTSPNATLPAGTPRTMFCSAFRPGPLRLELAFVDPEPVVNLARFQALRAKQDQFVRALGESVVWDEMSGRKDTRVYVVSQFESIDDRDQWPAMTDWLIERHVRFRRAIDEVGGLDVGPTSRTQ